MRQLNVDNLKKHNQLRVYKVITFLCLLLPLKMAATTVEQEQRFLYYFYEAERLWQDEQYADAFSLFEFCNALNPDDPITNRYLGHVYQGCKRTELALTFYKRAWEQAPETCWKEYAITLYNTGMNSNQMKALQVMKQTSKLVSQDEDLWDHLRDAYIGVKDYKQAIEAQKLYDQIVRDEAYSAINLYRIYMLMQKPKKALEALEMYLENDPGNLQFQLYRMQLCETMHQPSNKLIPIYQNILQLDPYNALVLNNYAYLLATNHGDLKLAEKMSSKAVQADPQNPVFLDTYAWVLYQFGQQELAKLYIRQAINLYKGHDIPKEIQQHYNTIHKE